MIARFLKKYWREDTNKQTQHLLNISRLPCYVFYIDLQMLIQVELEDQQTNIQIPCVDTNTNRKSDQKTKSLHLHFVGDALPLRKNLPKSQSSENISSKYRLNTKCKIRLKETQILTQNQNLLKSQSSERISSKKTIISLQHFYTAFNFMIFISFS